MRKPRATKDDLYNALSYSAWQTGMELRAALEDKGYRAGHLRGSMYEHLSLWEDEKLVSSRERPTPLESYSGQIVLREYLRISTGSPKKLLDAIGGLEGRLGPSLA